MKLYEQDIMDRNSLSVCEYNHGSSATAYRLATEEVLSSKLILGPGYV